MVSFRVKSFYFVVLSGLLFFVALPVEASSPFIQQDTLNFFSVDTGTYLANPGLLETGPDGKLAVWDQDLKKFYYRDLTDTASDDTQKKSTRHEEFRSFLRDVSRGEIIRQWKLGIKPGGFFDQKGKFWFYDRSLSSEADTFSLYSRYPEDDQLALPGPVRSFVPTENQLIIQLQSGTPSLIRWDPYSPNSVVDTASYQLKGRLIGYTPQGRYLTLTEDTVRAFNGNEQIHSRTFSSVRDLEVQDEDVYVLSDEGSVVRLNSKLSAQYTFFLPGDREYRSIAVYNETAYLSTPEGLFSTVLDESQRSFFSQSSEVSLEHEVRTLPSFDNHSNITQKIWHETGSATTDLVVRQGKEELSSIRYSEDGLSRTDSLKMGALDTNKFQFFKVDSTYWNGEDSFYYYFPEEKSVEEYDTKGRLQRHQKFTFDDGQKYRNIKFIAATDTRVVFSGTVNTRHNGFRRNLIFFDWDGRILRTPVPRHPFREGDYTSSNSPEWQYGGGDNLYELHDQYIQVYDLYGYPRQTINNVYKPVDVRRGEGRLFVLDLNGNRVQTFSVPESPVTRFAVPPSDLSVVDAVSNGSKRILAAKSPNDEKLSLYEYRSDSLDVQTVLEHPARTLRYPTISDNGDTLFFFGSKPTSDRWTLYRSDTIKYSARPLTDVTDVRDKGFFLDDKNLVFVPIDNTGGTAPSYRYLHPTGDTDAMLRNSDKLKKLVPGGFTGFYGLMEYADTHVIATGYLSRESETAPLKWSTADTVYRSERRLSNLFTRSGDLYFVRKSQMARSRLGQISSGSFVGSEAPQSHESVDWLADVRGEVRWIRKNGSGYDLVLRTADHEGHFFQWFPGDPPSDGGIQGSISSSSPISLDKIPLTVQPGGRSTTTKKSGRFSLANVPSGYISVRIPSHKYHFSYPISLAVQSGEYTVRESLPLANQEELLLLNRGLAYFDREGWDRVHISLNAFRELTQEGPYFEWTNGFMEIVQRKRGDTDAQRELFEKAPQMFTPQERKELLESERSPSDQLAVYRKYSNVLDESLRSYFRYRIDLLRRKKSGDRLNARSLEFPVFGKPGRAMPRVKSAR